MTVLRQQMLGYTVTESFRCYLYTIVKLLLVKIPKFGMPESDRISVDTGRQPEKTFWYLLHRM